jgi:hypothetical protein
VNVNLPDLIRHAVETRSRYSRGKRVYLFGRKYSNGKVEKFDE